MRSELRKSGLRKEAGAMSEVLIKEIKNVSLITAALGLVQILILIPTRYFGAPAVLGTLLGCAAALLNFTLMGIILERAVSNSKSASGFMSVGYILRLALICAAVIWSMKADYLNYVCVIIPLLFPQISIFIINLVRKKKEKSDNERT